MTIPYTYLKRAIIVVDKVTDPSGDQESFDFALSGGPDGINQSFALTHASTPHNSGAIKAGSYSVAETVPAGWDLTELSCVAIDYLGQPGGVSTFTESLLNAAK